MIYTPAPFGGGDLTALQTYVQQELGRIAEALQSGEFAVLLLEVRHTPPPRLIEGLITIADGADWDPGFGAGIYAFYNSGWHRLG